MRCFYCDKICQDGIELNKDEALHVFNVLKLKKGEEILLNDCKGTLATARIIESQKIIPLEIRKIPEPKNKIHLFVSPPRKQQLDQLITQCCEVGVWSINLIKTERSISLPEGKKEKVERWQSRIIEACKQSQNPYAPEISPLMTFDEAIKRIKKNNLMVFYGSTNNNKAVEIPNVQDCGGEIGWFVGPEGGFSEKELLAMQTHNFTPLMLGNWIMRVETAAVVGVALLQELFYLIQAKNNT